MDQVSEPVWVAQWRRHGDLGASAALAAALPNHPLKERATLFTVIVASVLSTLTMIVYPLVAQAVGASQNSSCSRPAMRPRSRSAATRHVTPTID